MEDAIFDRLFDGCCLVVGLRNVCKRRGGATEAGLRWRLPERISVSHKPQWWSGRQQPGVPHSRTLPSTDSSSDSASIIASPPSKKGKFRKQSKGFPAP
jgi:hypothetical protein